MLVISMEDHSGVSFLKLEEVGKDGVSAVKGNMYRRLITTSPYNVTGGANVEIAFVLLQDGSFFYFI